MRDKNGVSIGAQSTEVGWDEYEEWLYTQPLPDEYFSTVDMDSVE